RAVAGAAVIGEVVAIVAELALVEFRIAARRWRIVYGDQNGSVVRVDTGLVGTAAYVAAVTPSGIASLSRGGPGNDGRSVVFLAGRAAQREQPDRQQREPRTAETC